MARNILSLDDIVTSIETDETHFWKSFKSVAAGVKLPEQATEYAKGGEFTIAHGLTVIRGTVANTGGKLVDAYKRADIDDVKYLTEAGFTVNRGLDIPTLHYTR